MRERYRNVLNAFFGSCWAIMPDKLEAMVDVLSMRAAGESTDFDARDKRRPLPSVRGKVQVLPVYGVISQRMNMMMEFSGGTSTDLLGRAFDRAVADPEIGAIVFDVDSPGGSVFGVQELATKILQARGTKPVVAVANSLAASAAYWIASAADELIVTPSGEVGSIGVYGMHMDWSGYNEKEGIKPTYVSAGKYKVEGHPDAPLGDDAKAAMQESVDTYYEAFVGGVAKARGVKASDVRSGFGEGRVVTADKAVSANMADRVATLEQILTELAGNSRKTSSKRSECPGCERQAVAAGVCLMCGWEADEPVAQASEPPKQATSVDTERRKLRLLELESE